MIERTLLVGHQANLEHADPTRQPFDSSASGRLLDAEVPSWRNYRAMNLLQSLNDHADIKKRAETIARLFNPDVLVLFGRDVARAYGLDGDPRDGQRGEWFTFYRRPIAGRERLVVLVPHPSPRNRFWNTDETRESLRGLFHVLDSAETPEQIIDQLEETVG